MQPPGDNMYSSTWILRQLNSSTWLVIAADLLVIVEQDINAMLLLQQTLHIIPQLKREAQ